MSRESANKPDCAACKCSYREHGKSGKCFRIKQSPGAYTRWCECQGYRSKEIRELD